MKYLEQYPLPEHVADVVRIRWMISHWCNYTCDFCGVPVYFTRSERFGRQDHAFDYYPVERWLGALKGIPKRWINMVISGGEPMLDSRNMVPLLQGLLADERFRIRINTNASWDPSRYADVDAAKLGLIISYHPKQTDFPSFRRRVNKIRDAGFPVLSVHSVCAPENVDEIEDALLKMEEDGFTVEAVSMHATGKYLGREYRSPRELQMMRQFSPPIQAHFVVNRPPVKGEACWHPSMSYDLNYNGEIRIACTPQKSNFLETGAPGLTPYAAACPHTQCECCYEMLRSLVNPPGYSGGMKAFYGDEYHEEMKALRTARKAGLPVEGEELLADWDNLAADGMKPPVRQDFVPLSELSNNGAYVFGYIDKLTGTDALQALNRSRIVLSGWAASSRVNEPVQSVELYAADRLIARIDAFYPRPEVVEAFQRPDLLNSGWRTWSFLPQLPKGVHPLTARVKTLGGLTGELPPFTLEIVD